ncbi:MAG: DUF3859 domain-containing protein [Proteobacteria bacterium]|nr:DUF3859 domain-containing protein [Pseudomonadota bacterium]
MDRYVCGLAASLAAFLFISVPPASAGVVYDAKLVEQGIFDCGVRSYRPSETGGNTYSVNGCQLKESTNVVRGQIGVMYGCKFSLIGSPNGEDVIVEATWRIPPPGAKNEKTGEYFLMHSNYWHATIGEISIFAWTPDNEGEVVAGKWLLEIRVGGQVLGSCAFDVRT